MPTYRTRHQLRPIRGCLAAVAVLCALWAGQATAADDPEEKEPERWLEPHGGDLELRIAGDLSHLFRGGLTDFEIEFGFGYFFSRWISGGVTGGLGHAPGLSSHDSSGNVSALKQALTVGALRTVRQGWHGTTKLWLRFFPLAPFEMLPQFLGPHATLEFGPRYTQNMTPDLLVSGSLGLHFYPTEQFALGPEIGYTLAIATDQNALFAGSRLDHVVSATWNLSFFFTP